MDDDQADVSDRADRERFSLMFENYAHRVRSYARRHCDSETADEVVADTFLTAWRRRADVPADPLAWLLVTARNLVSNQRRQHRGRTVRGLDHQDLSELAAAEPGADVQVVDRSIMLAALAALTHLEREAVLLIAWDGLDVRAAAAVAGCSVRAFTVRLHRARRRLDREFDAAGEDPLPGRRVSGQRPVPSRPAASGPVVGPVSVESS